MQIERKPPWSSLVKEFFYQDIMKLRCAMEVKLTYTSTIPAVRRIQVMSTLYLLMILTWIISPSRYHDVIMLDLIKALSDLTVLIKVKYTSLKRPKSVTSFSGQYPFYTARGNDVIRTGTGRISVVEKNTESDIKGTCPCGKCQHTDTPSKMWGEVYVWTGQTRGV
ncbi:uncharacterized protein LOC131949365 [Physella acuta]|uniref:uncharacterized protein LOC131949365 n=1 Tax=Physella acuta TaxID=109671 RepID=UPI0027DD1F95|nr:uncharacterized protein LOC131949365 [Physella acuta]